MTNNGTPGPPEQQGPDPDNVLKLNGANLLRGELHAAAGALRNLGDGALDAYEHFVRETSEGKRGGKGPPPAEARDGMDYDLWIIDAIRTGRRAVLEADKRAAARGELRAGGQAIPPNLRGRG